MLRGALGKNLKSTMKLDPAVVKLLSLDPENTSVSSDGGGGCSSASTSRITAKLDDGSEKMFFMKTGRGKDAELMFEGKYSSLYACSYVIHFLLFKDWLRSCSILPSKIIKGRKLITHRRACIPERPP